MVVRQPSPLFKAHTILCLAAMIAASVLCGMGRITGDTAVSVILAAAGMGGAHALAHSALARGESSHSSVVQPYPPEKFGG